MNSRTPFVLGSARRANGKVIARSYDLVWGAWSARHSRLDASKCHQQTAPRYANLRGRSIE